MTWTLTLLADAYFSNLQPICTLVGFLTGVGSFVYYRCDVARAFDALVKGFTASTLPMGIAFVYCSAYSSYVAKIPDASAAFLIGGTALVLMPFLNMQKIIRALAQSDPLQG